MTQSSLPLHPTGSQENAPVSLSFHWSRRDWGVLLLLLLLVTLFFWRILTPNLADRASFPPGDFSYQFWAFSTFEVRGLSAGELPLWNPYTYAGAPFWADIQSAVLYLPSLLTLLLSGPWGFSLFALEVEAIAHFWLAGVFTYLFVRRLTRHRGAALFAAITFTFGGYLTGYPSQQLAVLETDVWLPLVLFFVDRALVDRSGEMPYLRPNLSNTLAASLAWGMALLAGHPQSAVFVFYTFILYAAFLLLAYRKEKGAKVTIQQTKKPDHLLSAPYALLLSPVLVAIIGLGLSAVAWLPGLEYMRLSVRAAGFYDKMAGGFPLYDPIQMLLPGSVSFYSPLYVGVLPLLLAVWTVLLVRRRETKFWGGITAVAFLLSFGGETFLYTPFYLLIPGFSIFRDQERIAFIVSFGLAVLAGYGFKSLVLRTSHLKSPIASLRRAVGWLLVGAVGLVILFFYGLNSVGWQDDSPFNLLLSRSVWLAILLALTWGIMKIGEWRTESNLGSEASGKRLATAPYSLLPSLSSLLAACYLLLTIFDLFTVNWKTNIYPAMPETQTAMPAVVQAIRDDITPGEVFRVYNEYRIYENYGVPYALEDTWGASPLRLAYYDTMHRSLRMERLWQLLNVKYVITWRQELYVPSEIIYQEPVGDEITYVHRLNEVSPRAWLVHQIQEVAYDTTLVQLDAFDFDPAKTALVPPGMSLSLETPPTSETGRVDITHRTNSSLVFDVSTPSDALLVLSEVYYPGWQATIDGEATSIVQTDYALRGVPVPAGEHEVKVTYRPMTFTWGAIVSGGTWGILAAGSFSIWLRRRQRTPKRQGEPHHAS